MSTSHAHQEISRCKGDDKVVNAPNYKPGVTYDGPSNFLEGRPPMSIIHISVDAKSLNADDLLLLALKLKKDFCKEERLFAVLYDDPAYIKQIYYSAHPLFHRAEESQRGYYYLDRKTGEEYITYSTVSNFHKHPENRVKIGLGAPTVKKLESRH